MSQRTTGIHKIFSYPFFYSLTQKLMSGESKRASLVKNIITKKNAKVLDVGCGTSKILDNLPYVRYFGYDVSKKYITYAKQKYKNKKNASFFCKKFSKSELEKLPKFDYVLLFGILHHLNDSQIAKLLFLIKKVLKKKGILITCDPVFLKNQNLISKILIMNDVGKNVRFKNHYLNLLMKYFKNIKSRIDNQKFIPYDWFITFSNNI